MSKELDGLFETLENDLLSKYEYNLLLNYITNLQKELDHYKNNWEELKKMFEADEHFEDGCYCGEIFKKMKELEEDK